MRGSGTRWVGSGVGVGASLLLHALLIAPFILGASPQRSRIPNKQGAGAAAIVSAQEPVMTLIYLNQTNPNERQYDLNTIASRGFASNDALLQIASPDPTPALETLSVDIRIDDSAAPTEAVGDQANHALLFGRYVGQIKARIQRAWLRPRTAIGAALFNCRLQITQDRRGNAKETTLQKCNGDYRWHLSLVEAIQRASPLPAPPDPSAFADAVTLEFESAAFVAGQSHEGFEPETRAMVAAAQDERSHAQLHEFEDQLRSSTSVNNTPIDLRLTGGSVTVPRGNPASDTLPALPATNGPPDKESTDPAR